MCTGQQQHSITPGSTLCRLLAVCTMVWLSLPLAATATDYERPQPAEAKNLVKPTLLQGSHHRVKPKVHYDGFYYTFTVDSDFGTFTAESTESLLMLIQEINAIAAMKKVEVKETALASLKQSGKNTATGLKNLFTEPESTLRGAAQGIGSLFNRASETVGRRKVTDAEDNRLAQLVGFTKSKGQIANTFTVNVYSTNTVLQEELDRLAWADYLGGVSVGLATSVAPGVGGVVLTTSGTARLLKDVINTTPPSELWLQNKNDLLAMGMNPDLVTLFLNNPVFNPAQYTIMVAALKNLKGVANRQLFLNIALQASTRQMADVITKLVVMASQYHQHVSPLKQFSSMARLAKARNQKGAVVVLLPTDHLLWLSQVAELATALKQENTGKLELWTLGTVSSRARNELTALGWEIHEKVRRDLVQQHKQ